jgi:Fe-S cluster assembly protein SufD
MTALLTRLPTRLPTRRDEAWRYADLKSLGALWPERREQLRSLSGADLTLEDRITGNGWTDERVEIAVSEGGRLTGTIEQTMDADGVTTQLYMITLAAGASADLTLVNSGGRYGRLALDISLHEGASLDLGAAIVGGSSQTLEVVTHVRHLEPGATSRQTVRAVLGGMAVGSYLGQVAVARAAQKTDAEQSFKALLLDRGATANAKPELEIFADDVKCAHGASVGELDRTALFYIESRGIPPHEAEALLAQAFVDDAITALPEGQARTALLGRLAMLVAAR